MTWIQAVVLGLVQGVTELLPISSSGHLILLPSILGWGIQPLVFDTTLHLGTASALIFYFYSDILKILKSIINDLPIYKLDFLHYGDSSKLGLYVVLGCLPAGIIGLLFGDLIEDTFRSSIWVAVFLFIGTVLMIFANNKAKLDNNTQLSQTNNGLPVLTVRKSLLIGLFQATALFSGISRSGATISGGLLNGLNKENSAKFSFLLSIPIVLLAGIFKLFDSFTDLGSITTDILILGFFSSFLSGVLAIKFLTEFLKKYNLDIFIYYRILLVLYILFTVI